MLNKEKYTNELIDMALHCANIAVADGKPVNCFDTSCANCDLYDPKKSCTYMRKKWANSEYEEKVDWSKVKPGTPIFVQDIDNGSWGVREFAFYLNNQVICYSAIAKDSDTPMFKAWKRARLTCP